MPNKPLRPCKEFGCPALVPVGVRYCPKHAPLHQKKPENSRESSYKRGYGPAWQKARKAYLAKHPLCVECLKQGKYVLATDVDHIVAHRGDMRLFWDSSNWQALCHSCHSRKTDAHDKRITYTYRKDQKL